MSTIRLLWFVPSPVAVVAAALSLTDQVDVHALRNPSSDAQYEALASGAADVVVTAMDNVMDWNLRPGPRDFRIVAQLERTTPLTLVGQMGKSKLETLAGATILVDAPRNGFIVALRAMLAQNGIDSETYKLEQVGGVKERYDALVSGRGDATLLGPPYDGMAIQAGLVRIASVQEAYPDFPGQGLVMSAAALERMRPPLSAWLRGLDAARQRMDSDIGLARQALLQAGFPPPGVEAMLRAAPVSLCPDRAGIELLIAHRRDAKLPGADTTYEGLVELSLLPTE